MKFLIGTLILVLSSLSSATVGYQSPEDKILTDKLIMCSKKFNLSLSSNAKGSASERVLYNKFFDCVDGDSPAYILRVREFVMRDAKELSEQIEGLESKFKSDSLKTNLIEFAAVLSDRKEIDFQEFSLVELMVFCSLNAGYL